MFYVIIHCTYFIYVTYSVGHLVKNNSDYKRKNLLLPFLINSNGQNSTYFTHWLLLLHLWTTNWDEKTLHGSTKGY